MNSLDVNNKRRGHDGRGSPWTVPRMRALPAAFLLMMVALRCAGADVFSVAALEVAVERGDVRAMTQLAAKYELGDGVARNFLKSNYLYCRAAHMGHAEAQFTLGGIYANGRGVARDHGIAAGLYARAAAQGHDHAKRLLQYLQEQLKISVNSATPACVQPEDALVLRLSRELPPAGTGRPEVKGGR